MAGALPVALPGLVVVSAGSAPCFSPRFFVFKGNTGDPKTLYSQVKKLKERFRLSHVWLGRRRGCR